MSDFDVDATREAAQDLKRLMGMSDAEVEEYIKFPFNRRLMAHLDELSDAKIIAEVTEATYCLAGCKVGQKLVIKAAPAMLLPEESDCPLCVKAIGPVSETVMQLWDRMSEGLDPNEGTTVFVSCLDQGIKYGGLGNVRFRVRVEKGSQTS